MKRKDSSEERREKRDETPGRPEDVYQPAALTDGPKKYDFDDWASI